MAGAAGCDQHRSSDRLASDHRRSAPAGFVRWDLSSDLFDSDGDPHQHRLPGRHPHDVTGDTDAIQEAPVRIVIAGGGTAGHVNPAVAVADALRGHDVSFIGTRAGAEARLVPDAGYRLEPVEVAGFDRGRPLSILPAGLRALGAVRASRRILKAAAPDVVLGVGGYVSLPACLAARSRRIPIVIHEQNIVLGLANKMCRRSAEAVAVSFEATLAEAGPKGRFTGNPVAKAFAEADLGSERARALETYSLEDGRRTLLVFGGSQGALRINDAAAGLAALWKDRSDLQVLHITGAAHGTSVRAAVGDDTGALIYRQVDFVDRMVSAYAVADLALCRGGATTVAELGVTGVPALIVPYPYHRDRQQERHGNVLAEAGAAIVVADADVTAGKIDELAGGLLADPDRLAAMGAAARTMGVPDAADRLARVVEEAARERLR
ncbi:MAG: undecaprenyldiphospho-muramoylpentapeptide beta-N-acetylglucosaminyltransferase [Actinobacteria bacterium]|nr:undecaprenyldiphospho-muramoylpentapeptide beta-N-acetylglucosaminyltransferase [Actinomycetota bacterium]